MRYVAHVTIAFAAEVDDASFDIWENVLVLNSDNPRQALKDAISKSRVIFDDSENWHSLGYPSKPIVYAVKSLHSEVELPSHKTQGEHLCMILSKVATFSEDEMRKLRLFEVVSVPYGVMHIDSYND